MNNMKNGFDIKKMMEGDSINEVGLKWYIQKITDRISTMRYNNFDAHKNFMNMIFNPAIRSEKEYRERYSFKNISYKFSIKQSAIFWVCRIGYSYYNNSKIVTPEEFFHYRIEASLLYMWVKSYPKEADALFSGFPHFTNEVLNKCNW